MMMPFNQGFRLFIANHFVCIWKKLWEISRYGLGTNIFFEHWPDR